MLEAAGADVTVPGRPPPEASARGNGPHRNGTGSRVVGELVTIHTTRECSVAPQQDGTGQDATGYRIEHDSMGEVRVPEWAKWRGPTPRAGENIPPSRTPPQRGVIRAPAAVQGGGA